MKVVNRNEIIKYTDRKTAVALGSFDALHKGHLKVIGGAVEFAKKNHLLSLVQLVEATMDERVKTLEQRLSVLESMEVDIVVVENFTEDFKSVKYNDFVSQYINGFYNAKAVFAGENYRFGYGAEGNTKKLTKECTKYGIDVFIQPCVEKNGVISSSRIRELVKSGKMEKVSELMSVPYSIWGEVVHGKGVGRSIDFPTANINIPNNMVVPKDGVYLSKVRFDNKEFFGITNVGSKPTVDIEEKNIETYISDYNGDLYGKTIEVQFLKYLRDIKKFDSLEKLKEQLEKDKESIKK